MTDDDTVRYNVQMPKQLREDAKANAERGELAGEVRDVFRRKAYGMGGEETPSEIEQTKAELREVRDQIDEFRAKRDRIDRKIQTKESRVTRLEERLSELKDERSEVNAKLDVLENMLRNGERMWPVRIKNAVDVDRGTAEELYQELQARNGELPPVAFEEPDIDTPADWRKADR